MAVNLMVDLNDLDLDSTAEDSQDEINRRIDEASEFRFQRLVNSPRNSRELKNNNIPSVFASQNISSNKRDDLFFDKSQNNIPLNSNLFTYLIFSLIQSALSKTTTEGVAVIM